MILGDFLKALAQLADRRFLRVLALGVALSAALLFGLYWLLSSAVAWFAPESVTLPWIGTISWVDNMLSWASLGLMLLLSFFLMTPVAAAFTGLFLDDVAEAVEARHYPALPPAPPLPVLEQIRDALVQLALVIAVNLPALALYLVSGPLAPLAFWALNGFLLGREYFQMAAMRRIGRDGARALRRRHPAQIWLAGALMAVPLSLPVVNLVVPVLGAATFTHLFHRLNRAERGQKPG